MGVEFEHVSTFGIMPRFGDLSIMGDQQPSSGAEDNIYRCSNCDSVITNEQVICVMCGASVSAPPQFDNPESIETSAQQQVSLELPLNKDENYPEQISSLLIQKRSPAFKISTAVFLIVVLLIGTLILRFQGPVSLAQFMPTVTIEQILPTFTPTSTGTAVPTETAIPSLTPTITNTPAPTDTPRPPRIHVVASGETLIGLSFIYRISPESIAEANEFPTDTQVQVNQNLIIPWPTATPPLEIMTFEVNGATVLLDPRGCEQVEVQSGDSLVAIAARYSINFEWLADINRIQDPQLLQPGDIVCIPDVLYDTEGVLAPTPGPSPTPTVTSLPAGPQLLFPVDGTTFEVPEEPILLQWAAVKNLAENEQYMVELRNLDSLDSRIFRAFTRDNGFRVPTAWRPQVANQFTFEWRVAIVKVEGFRSDGFPIYSEGGGFSQPSQFEWKGRVPTPTPVPTSTLPPTATPGS